MEIHVRCRTISKICKAEAEKQTNQIGCIKHKQNKQKQNGAYQKYIVYKLKYLKKERKNTT